MFQSLDQIFIDSQNQFETSLGVSVGQSDDIWRYDRSRGCDRFWVNRRWSCDGMWHHMNCSLEVCQVLTAKDSEPNDEKKIEKSVPKCLSSPTFHYRERQWKCETRSDGSAMTRWTTPHHSDTVFGQCPPSKPLVQSSDRPIGDSWGTEVELSHCRVLALMNLVSDFGLELADTVVNNEA